MPDPKLPEQTKRANTKAKANLKPKSKHNAFNQLVDQAYQLTAYTQAMDLGGYEQRLQAKHVMNELERLMKVQNPWLLWQMLEASLIPKMIRLAKDINLYQSILTLPAKRNKQASKFYKPKQYLHHETHHTSAYDNFKPRSEPVALTEEKREEVLGMLDGLQKLLQEKNGEDKKISSFKPKE